MCLHVYGCCSNNSTKNIQNVVNRLWTNMKTNSQPVNVINKKVKLYYICIRETTCAFAIHIYYVLQCINVVSFMLRILLRVSHVVVLLVCCLLTNNKSPEPTTGCGACGFVKEACYTHTTYLNERYYMVEVWRAVYCIHTI